MPEQILVTCVQANIIKNILKKKKKTKHLFLLEMQN